MIALKLVWFRIAMYFFLPMISAFMSQTETWSGETWDHTHWFIKLRLIVGCSLPGFLALVAFIDSAMHKARAEVENSRQLKSMKEIETTITKRPTDQP